MSYFYTILVYGLPIIGLVYLYYKRKYSYWSSRGVVGPPATFPFGHFLPMLTNPKKADLEWVKKQGPVLGIYHGTAPVLLVADPDLARQVLIKDFPAFVNRSPLNNDHPIFKKNLLNLEDEQWKRIRSIVSPTFSSGKLKAMHHFISRCTQMLVDHLTTVVDDPTLQGRVNFKDVVTGYTIDVIAATSFVTETNCNADKGNVFKQNGLHIATGSVWRFLLQMILPRSVNRAFGNTVAVAPGPFNFFINLSREIVRQRKASITSGLKGAKRNDLVQLLIDAYAYEEEAEDYQKFTASSDKETISETSSPKGPSSSLASKRKQTLTEDEIIAQCIIFFTAGFETTATTTANVVKKMAELSEIQTRLAEELELKLGGVNPDSDEYYDLVVNGCPLLEAVIKETLRMESLVPRVQRRVGVVGGYELAGIKLEKETEVDVAVNALHYNPKYYSEPEVFKPERFLPENRHLLVPYTFLPFGDGPRNCIGMRFAYNEIKFCLASVLRTFEVRMQPPKPKKKSGWFNFGISNEMAVTDVPVVLSRRK